MPVQQLGIPDDGKGFEKSYEAFLNDHISSSNALLNISEGKPQTIARPPHNHAAHQWPKLVYSSTSTLVVNNEAEFRRAEHQGYRLEPFIKPQVAILSPEVEKAALQAKIAERDGALANLSDQMLKMQDDMKRLANAKADEAAAKFEADAKAKANTKA